MKCLVTGGSGFIGSHLVRELSKRGHKVTVFSNGMPAGHALAGGTLYCLHDIVDDPPPEIHPDYFPFDWCFHLAALADVVPSIERPLDYHRVNVDGTVNMLDYCVRTGVKRFIYASSTSIYGIPEEYPTPETAPADPQYPYALTKYIAEQYVMRWGKFYKLPVVSLRINFAYGPGMKSKCYGAVLKVFMAQKANHAPFTVVGDGSQSRDFVFVEDVADAFIKAAESDVSGEIFNVGYGEPRQLNDVIRLLGGGEVVYLPKRPGEPDRTWPDIRKIYTVLGWEPKVSLEEGMKVMLEHLDDWKGETVWTPETIKEATKEWYKYLS